MGKIYAAKINHMTNPMGFLMERTVFSWKVKDCRGKEQKWARIVVAEDASFEKTVCDTGEADLDSRAARLSLKMKPCSRYYWKVTVATDADEIITSETQFFETAKMEEPWKGKWITCDSAEPRHPVFSREIIPEKQVTGARLYISGLGLYEAYITPKEDGSPQRIGEEYLTPYCNDYKRWIQYQTYDITLQISEGGTLSVLLGNGWYKGRFGLNSEGKGGWYVDEWKLIAEIRLDYADGTQEIIGTDETWTVTRSRLTFSNLYDGEHRDDTLEDREPEQAVAADPPGGKLMERLSLPVKVQQERTPVELIRTPKGELVFDLGQEITGSFRLRVRAKRGAQVRIQTGEVLQDGCFYNENLRTAKSEYIYISDGTEKEIQPHFTYYGYRYVKVSGVEELSVDDFTALVLCSDYETAGSLRTGHELVNRLISNVEWGMRGNFLDVPTDCPQRDERMGWTGDTQVFSATACYLADTYAFYKKYLFDLYQEQKDLNGMVPETVPVYGQTKCSCAWGDAACIIPWNVYMFSGDVSILEDQFDSMKDWVDYIRTVDGEHHGWRQMFHYGDWLALDRAGASEGNAYGATDEGYVADVYYAASADIVAKAADILGRKEEAGEYRALADRQWQEVRREYFTSTGRCAVKTQTGLLLALKYHISSDEEKTRQMLKKLLRDSGNKLNTGFVGTPLLCNVLTDNGMTDAAYRLLLNEEYPGWLREVKLGATTIWERWNSLGEDGKVSSTGMNSFNHYAYGAILEWMFRHVGGIDVRENAPGAKTVRIAPKVHADVKSAEAVYDSASGTYRCGWEILDDNRIRVSLEVPFGAEAEVQLPYADTSVYLDESNPLFASVRDGVCHVKAGSYRAEYPASEQLKKTYSTESSMEELLNHPAVRAFLSTLIEVDMIPDTAYPMSLRTVAEVFGGGGDEEQFQMLDAALAKF